MEEEVWGLQGPRHTQILQNTDTLLIKGNMPNMFILNETWQTVNTAAVGLNLEVNLKVILTLN